MNDVVKGMLRFSCFLRNRHPQANDLRYVDEASHHLDEQCPEFPLESKTKSWNPPHQ